MEFDLTWILIGLPATFVMGWAASRLDLRQLRWHNQQNPKAYFKGLNFLLNEQQDQAIDAFIEAVQNDPDTSELHFALGNLFRRRGEFERAVRVHEHLLARADLSQHDRDRAQHALALDFLKAGLLDRAEAALHKLAGTAFDGEAGLALLAIFERSRDWTKANQQAEHLTAQGQGDFGVRRTHYLCERAAEQATLDQAQAITLLHQAEALQADTARPGMALAQWHSQQGDASAALATLVRTTRRVPNATPLLAAPLAQAALQNGPSAQAEVQALLQGYYDQRTSLDVMDALVALDTANNPTGEARDGYLRHLEREPSLVAAAKWIAGERLEHEQFHPQVQRALDHAVVPLTRYRCAACGFSAKQYFWQCPGCQSWDSYPARRAEEL